MNPSSSTGPLIVRTFASDALQEPVGTIPDPESLAFVPELADSALHELVEVPEVIEEHLVDGLSSLCPSTRSL